MQPMNEDVPLEAPVTTAVLLAEVRGIAAVQAARFDGMEREQASQANWLGRLSDALERQIQQTTRFISLESVLGAVAGQVSDIKLDSATLNERLIVLETSASSAALARKGVYTVIGLIITALLAALSTKLIHP
jgi:hypothetical protein